MVNIFSSLGVKFEGHIGFQKLHNCYVVKALMAHTFFVEFHVFKPALHKKYLIHLSQIHWDNYSFLVMIFQCLELFFFCSSI